MRKSQKVCKYFRVKGKLEIVRFCEKNFRNKVWPGPDGGVLLPKGRERRRLVADFSAGACPERVLRKWINQRMSKKRVK